MKVNTTGKLAATALLGLLGPVGAMADEALPTGYVMSYFADAAQGAAVEDGAYEIVIDKLTRKDARGARRIADQVNLCVAYTKTKQLDEATRACDEALAMAGRRIVRPNSVGFYHSDRNRASEERAIALVNRGVLHAVAGDVDLARELFEAADDLDTSVDAAAMNLLVLQRELAERDS